MPNPPSGRTEVPIPREVAAAMVLRGDAGRAADGVFDLTVSGVAWLSNWLRGRGGITL